MISRICTILLLLFVSANAVLQLTDDQKELAATAVSAILNGTFDTELHHLDSVIAVDKTDPFAPVLKLAVLGMRDVDFESTLDSAAFIATYAAASQKIDIFEMRNGRSSYTCTLTGLVKAIRSTFYLRLRIYGSALQTGLDALKELKAARELDHTNTDVNFFLGLYDYAKADLKKSLWWVMFWYPGDRFDGIRQLEECRKSAQITWVGAALSLSDIYVRENKPDRSLAIITSLKQQFPSSRFVLWGEVKYLESQKQYEKAAKQYEKLAESYEQCKDGTFNALVTRNHQAHMLISSGDRKKARTIGKDIISRCTDRRTRPIKKDTEKMMEQLDESQN